MSKLYQIARRDLTGLSNTDLYQINSIAWSPEELEETLLHQNEWLRTSPDERESYLWETFGSPEAREDFLFGHASYDLLKTLEWFDKRYRKSPSRVSSHHHGRFLMILDWLHTYPEHQRSPDQPVLLQALCLIDFDLKLYLNDSTAGLPSLPSVLQLAQDLKDGKVPPPVPRPEPSPEETPSEKIPPETAVSPGLSPEEFLKAYQDLQEWTRQQEDEQQKKAEAIRSALTSPVLKEWSQKSDTTTLYMTFGFLSQMDLRTERQPTDSLRTKFNHAVQKTNHFFLVLRFIQTHEDELKRDGYLRMQNQTVLLPLDVIEALTLIDPNLFDVDHLPPYPSVRALIRQIEEHHTPRPGTSHA